VKETTSNERFCSSSKYVLIIKKIFVCVHNDDDDDDDEDDDEVHSVRKYHKCRGILAKKNLLRI
jgi:hypothetical protein